MQKIVEAAKFWHTVLGGEDWTGLVKRGLVKGNKIQVIMISNRDITINSDLQQPDL